MLPAKIGFIDGELLGVLGFLAGFIIWTLLPFFDSGRPGRRQRWITGIGVFVIAYVTAMTVFGYVAQ
jgi:quinol-cytochrome oxidoreductase complex cytochrome b subunit